MYRPYLHDQQTRRRLIVGFFGISSMGASSIPNILLAEEVKGLNIDKRSARVSFLSSKRSSGVLALKFDAALHLRVAARINGVDASAIVDSGAGRTIIDSTFASKNGILLRTGFNVAGITGNTHGHFADGMNITLGNLVIEDLPAGVLDLNPNPNGVDDAVDVILGREFFENVSVDIDIESKSIIFEDSTKEIELAHGNASLLKRTPRGTPYFPISINNDAPISAAFDLGYNGTILVSADYAEKTGLLTGRSVSTVASRGVEGLSISRVATLDKVKIAGVELENVPMEVPADWNRTIPAIVGFELLNRFHIVTDYRRSQIWLSPYKSKIYLPIPKDRSGIGAIPTQLGLRVLHIAEGSPAESAGLKPGDQIVKIDGERVDTAYIISHPRMGERPAGTQSELTLSDGRMIHLTLANYY